MNFLPSRDFLDSLGWTLLHFLWQGLVIAALFAGVLRLLRGRSPNLRYLAGCFALLLMFSAPIATFFSLDDSDDQEIPVQFTQSISTDITPDPSDLPAALRIAPARTPIPQIHHSTFSEKLEAALPWLVAAWSLGVLALSCRLFAGWLFIRRLRRTATAALLDPWQSKLKELARRIGVSRPLRLLQSALVEVPTVIGWLRPVILLPASCLAGLTAAQLESILAHELAHIRRHDYLVNLLQNLVETLLFYHPAVWWVSRRIRQEREHYCDDLAVKICGDAATYARALATLEELRPAPAQLALAASGAPLLERIRRLAGQPERNALRPAWPVAGLVAILLLALLAVGLRDNPTAAAQPTVASPITNQIANPPASTNAISVIAASASRTNSPSEPQLNFKIKIAEVDDSKAGTDGFTWLFKDGEPRALTNISPTFAFSEFLIVKSTNPAASNRLDYLHAEANPTPLSGLLSDAQYKSVVGKLEKQDGADLLTAPEVTTETGREAEIQVGSAISLVLGQPTPTNVSMLTNYPFGFMVDLVPHLAADGHTVELTLKASVGEFIGYEDPAHVTNSDGSRMPENWGIPRVRRREFTATVGVENAQTLVLGGLPTPITSIDKMKSKVPVLGDIPLIKYLFRSSKTTTNTVRKSLLFFVTPTLINHDGTRYHPIKVTTHPDGSAEVHRTQISDQTNIVTSIAAGQHIGSKLYRIHIPKVQYLNLPLPDVLANLSALAASQDPDKTGINFFSTSAALGVSPAKDFTSPVEMNLVTVTIDPPLENVSLGDVLDAVVRSASAPIQFSILDYAVVFSPRGPEPPPLEIRNFHVNPDVFFSKLGVTLTNDARTGLRYPPPSENEHFRTAVFALFNSAGADFSTNYPEKTFTYTSRHSVLTIRAKHEELDKIAAVLPLINPAGASNRPTTPVQSPQFSNTNDLIYYSKGRQAIISKLQDIRVDKVEYLDLPLTEVLKHLASIAKVRDSKKTGVNFFVTRPSDAGRPGEVDLQTGLPMVSSTMDMESVTITIKPPLMDIRLIDVLDAITKTASVPLKYSILDYAVVFSLRDTNEVTLETRTFHIDPRIFNRALESSTKATNNNPGSKSLGGSSKDSESAKPQENIRAFFTAIGADFRTNNPANLGKAFAWGDRRGILTVRSTRQDLDLIAVVIDSLNTPPPEINIKAKFVELTPGNARALGFNWTLHNVPLNTLQVTNNAVSGSSNSPTAGFPAGHSSVNGPIISSVSGILSEALYKIALTALEHETNAQIRDFPEFITESGRQVQLEATDAGTNGAQHFHFNPVLNIVPLVSADEFSVDLKIISTVQQFVGYDDPGKFVTSDTNGKPAIAANLPLPHFRLHTFTNNASVFDGQTFVFSARTPVVPDFPGSLPLITATPLATERNLIIFVTPTIINPDGTRYHAEEDGLSGPSAAAQPATVPVPPAK